MYFFQKVESLRSSVFVQFEEFQCSAVDVSMVFHLLGEVIDRSCEGGCVVMWDFSVYFFVT